MKKVPIVTLIIIIISLFILYFINTNEKDEKIEEINIENAETISDLLYTEVYIKEQDKYIPYLVLSNDYDGKTFLLRKYILNEDLRMNDYLAYYENCEMDVFLNTEFYENLPDETKNIIKNTTIEVLEEGYNATTENIIKIQRKIFLISYTELNLKQTYHNGIEGTPIEYFEKSEKRIAYTEDGNPSAYWLRSADTDYKSCFYGIGPRGEVGSGNSFGTNGVRPAFCVDKNLKVIKNTKIIEGEIVYIIK